MRYIKILICMAFLCGIFSCSRKAYPDNGPAIFHTGRNLNGIRVLDAQASRIRLIKSCSGCHGKHGDAMKSVSIRFKDLSDPAHFPIPYNDSLLFRFLDHDLKSDGSKANIGVIWKMSVKDKKDLVAYLKTL